MRRCWRAASRACAAAAIVATTPGAAQGQAPLIAAVQIDGRGHGHGVGMAQDGALAMGRAGADVRQILSHFYPGTSFGQATGTVRVPVFSGNAVELSFPEGGEIRGANHTTRVGAGGVAVFTREGSGTRVRTGPAEPGPTATTAPPSPTTSTTVAPPAASTTTTLLPVGDRVGGASTSGSTAQTARPASDPGAAQTAPPVYQGTVNVIPAGGGRIGLTPRGRRYRGVMEVTAVGGGLRFVNAVGVETYLRGMGEVRNPGWPAAGLQAQAIAARTYAMRAMAAGGELCDTQRCQVYLGSDAEYAAMDKAVAATSGQVLMYGNSLASAVYSANAGGHTANREEGFGLAGDGAHPYLRPSPYVTDNRGEWSVTVALSDVGRRLNYPGSLTGVNVVGRGPSGRATSVQLVGSAGDRTVTGIAFDRALGLRSTLFTVRVVMAGDVAALSPEPALQAPPEEASALADVPADAEPQPPEAVPVRLGRSSNASGTGSFSVVAAAAWGAVVTGAFVWRRRSKRAIFRILS